MRRGEAGQDEIDAMLGELRSSSALPLPKGLSRETLDLVARTLRDTDAALGAAETAEAAGLSRVTARRYLEHLVYERRVELELKYGGGRPEHRYRWAAR
jgi:response regulator of citrate/malate metabolism